MVVTPDQTQAPRITFPGMDPGEEFRFYFRKHPIRLWRAGGLLLLWMAAFIGLVVVSGITSMQDRSMARFLGVILCLFFIIPHIVFLIRVYTQYLQIVIVTDKKVHKFKRTLFAVDSHESVDLWVLQDVNKSQRGVVQNLLGFGTLILEAQNTRVIIHFAPRIDQTYNHIVHLREEARQRLLPTPRPVGEQQAFVPFSALR